MIEVFLLVFRIWIMGFLATLFMMCVNSELLKEVRQECEDGGVYRTDNEATIVWTWMAFASWPVVLPLNLFYFCTEGL